MTRNLLITFLLFLSVAISDLSAELKGKIDIGPAYVHLDILESGHTVDTKNLFAVRADACVLVYKGLCLKPTFLTSCNSTELMSGGIGIGHYTPIGTDFSITPSVGCNFTYLRTTVDLEIPFLPTRLTVTERFRSTSPYVGIDATWNFYPQWRLGGTFQYAWSRTTTIFRSLDVTSKTSCQGPSYAAVLEHDFNDCFSVNLGAAYNISLSKEKHGLRAAGVKLGFVYWF